MVHLRIPARKFVGKAQAASRLSIGVLYNAAFSAFFASLPRSTIVSQGRGLFSDRSVNEEVSKGGGRMKDDAAVIDERVAAPKEAWHLNAARESRVRRSLLGFLSRSALALIVWVVVLLGHPLLLSAQTLHYAKSPDVRNGEKVYKGGCIACQGSEGKGAPMASTGFRREGTVPDF